MSYIHYPSSHKIDEYSIVKLGGSVITSPNGTINQGIIKSLAEELSTYYGIPIIVHGGGSITKRVVKYYSLDSDFVLPDQVEFISAFQGAVGELNQKLMDIFLAVGLRCESVPPHTFMTAEQGKINSCDLTKINALLKRKIIPVLYGDAILDHARGYYLCSSDYIVSYLATKLQPEKTCFLTNVDGVYTEYPPSRFTKPLPIVDTSLLSQMQNDYKVGIGDMYTKLAWAMECASTTGLCCIINGCVRGNLTNALQGVVKFGTIVTS